MRWSSFNPESTNIYWLISNFSEVCGIYCDLFVLLATGLYTFEQEFAMLDMILFWMAPSNNKTIRLVLKVGIISCHKMDVTDTGYNLAENVLPGIESLSPLCTKSACIYS